MPERLPVRRLPPRRPAVPWVRNLELGLVAILLLTAGLVAGMVLERSILRDTSGASRFTDLDAAVTTVMDNYYYLPADPASRDDVLAQIRTGALDGALDALGDPYTRYIPPDDAATADENLEGQYGGIGIDIVNTDGLIVVNFVVPSSPAEAAGFARGDVLETIDGTPLDSLDINDVVRLLRGEVGQTTTIEAYRPSTQQVLMRTMTMENIVVPQVIFSMIPGTTIGHLKITQFGGQTVRGVRQAIDDLRTAGATGLVLDLRSNTGGLVDAAQQTIGMFIPAESGPAFIEDTRPGDGGEVNVPILPADDGTISDVPMVVLVDHSTASAAEIVAGAFKDYRRGPIIGETTFGKGSVQRIFRFDDGATMRVTVAEWFTPGHDRIQGAGITPQIEVTATGGDAATDGVLQTAVLLLERQSAVPYGTPMATPAGG